MLKMFCTSDDSKWPNIKGQRHNTKEKQRICIFFLNNQHCAFIFYIFMVKMNLFKWVVEPLTLKKKTTNLIM